MKNKIQLVIAMLFMAISFGQVPLTSQIILGDGGDLTSVKFFNDGTYITCSWGGAIKSTVTKSNAQGTVIWKYEGLEKVSGLYTEQTSDKGYVITGWTDDSAMPGIHPNESKDSRAGDIFVLKLSKNGEKEWQKAYGGNGNDWGEGIQQTNDGGYVVSGITQSKVSGDVLKSYSLNNSDFLMNIWLFKINSLGEIQSQTTIGGTEYDSTWRGLVNNLDGTFSFGGRINSTDFDFSGEMAGPYIFTINDKAELLSKKLISGYIDFSKNAEVDGSRFITSSKDSVLKIRKIDSRFNVIWEKSYDNYKSGIVTSIKSTSDGGYMVASHFVPEQGNGDLRIMKLNKLGAVEWKKDIIGSANDISKDIFEDANGYIVVANTESKNGVFKDNHGGFDVAIIRLNFSGEITEQRMIGGAGNERFDNDMTQAFLNKEDKTMSIVVSTTSVDGDVEGNNLKSGIWAINFSIEKSKLTTTNLTTVISTIGSAASGWLTNVDMTTTDGVNYILKDQKLIVGDLKFTTNHSLDTFWGASSTKKGLAVVDGQNIKVAVAGIYDVSFNRITLQYSLVESKLNVVISIIGDGVKGWETDVDMVTTDGEHYILKSQKLVEGGLKFRMNHWWDNLWGISDIQNVAVLQGQVFKVLEAGIYDITFNRITLEYSIVESKLSVGKFDAKTSIEIYPNPVENELNIQSTSDTEITAFEIYTFQGQLVISSQNPQNKINTSNLPKGMYIINVQTNKGTLTEKFVK